MTVQQVARAGDPQHMLAARLADPARLAVLRATALLDAPSSAALDRLTSLATRLIGAPASIVSLVDADRQFFASCSGVAEPLSTARETPLTHSFCQHVVAANAPLVIEDARDHPLVCENLAISDLGVIAYLGMPLTTDAGHTLGSLCVTDTQPRRWTEDEVAIMRDLAAMAMSEISLRLTLRDLAREREFARQVMETMGQGLIVTDDDGRFTYVNPAYAHMLGYEPAELLGTSPMALVGPDDREALQAVQAQRDQGIASRYEMRLRCRDGTSIHALITGVPRPDSGGVIAVVADLTERRRMEEALREAHRRLTFHTDNSPIAAVECDPHLRILRWSPGAERTFGWLADEVVGRRVGTDLTLLHPDDEPAVARLVERLLDGRDERNAFYNRNLTKDGRVIHCEWHNSVLRDAHGAVISIFSLALDVTAQAMLQEQLAHQALHDPLTGLPNRASLAGRFRQLLADEEHFAILYLDLDGFKEINDRLGHAAGDELLVVVARRLQRVVRAGDFVVRLGGDEFVVLVEHLRGAAEANALVRRVTAAIEEPIMLGGERVRVGVSVGVAHTTSDLRDPEALLNAADTAMYRVKRAESGFPAAVPPHPDDAAERVRAD